MGSDDLQNAKARLSAELRASAARACSLDRLLRDEPATEALGQPITNGTTSIGKESRNLIRDLRAELSASDRLLRDRDWSLAELKSELAQQNAQNAALRSKVDSKVVVPSTASTARIEISDFVPTQAEAADDGSWHSKLRTAKAEIVARDRLLQDRDKALSHFEAEAHAQHVELEEARAEANATQNLYRSLKDEFARVAGNEPQSSYRATGSSQYASVNAYEPEQVSTRVQESHQVQGALPPSAWCRTIKEQAQQLQAAYARNRPVSEALSDLLQGMTRLQEELEVAERGISSSKSAIADSVARQTGSRYPQDNNLLFQTHERASSTEPPRTPPSFGTSPKDSPERLEERALGNASNSLAEEPWLDDGVGIKQTLSSDSLGSPVRQTRLDQQSEKLSPQQRDEAQKQQKMQVQQNTLQQQDQYEPSVDRAEQKKVLQRQYENELRQLLIEQIAEEEEALQAQQQAQQSTQPGHPQQLQQAHQARESQQIQQPHQLQQHQSLLKPLLQPQNAPQNPQVQTRPQIEPQPQGYPQSQHPIASSQLRQQVSTADTGTVSAFHLYREKQQQQQQQAQQRQQQQQQQQTQQQSQPQRQAQQSSLKQPLQQHPPQQMQQQRQQQQQPQQLRANHSLLVPITNASDRQAGNASIRRDNSGSRTGGQASAA